MNSYDTLLEADHMLCKVVDPNAPYYGTLSLKGGNIQLSLMPDHRFVGAPNDGATITDGCVVLKSHHGHTITLSRIFETAPSFVPTELRKFSANEAIIGSSDWTRDKKVGKINAFVPQAENAFANVDRETKILRKLEGREKSGDEDLGGVNFVHDNTAISVKTLFEFPLEAQHRVKFLGPRVEIEFFEPIALNEAIDEIDSIITFLEMSTGARIKIHVFEVRQEGIAEAKMKFSAGDRPEIFCVVRSPIVDYVDAVPTFDRDSRQSPMWRTIYSGVNPDETKVLSEAMKIWVGRQGEWKNANIALKRMLGFGAEVSVERLINANNWLERIPGAKPVRCDLEKGLVSKLIERVKGVAKDLGIEDRQKRIEGCLRKIKSESQESWIDRLFHMVESRIPRDLNEEHFRQSVVDGFELRGEAAHGRIAELEARGTDSRVRSAFAFEALCLLLTIRDLPLTERGAGALEERVLQKMSWLVRERE